MRKSRAWSAKAAVAVLGVGLAASAVAQEPPRPDSIVVNGSGGAVAEAMQKAFFAPFEEKYGIRIDTTSPTDFGKLRAMVESGNVEWTATELDVDTAELAAEMGLLEPLDLSVVDLSGYPEEARHSHWLARGAYATALGYRVDAFPEGEHPQSWADFWDVENFPGPRALRNHPIDNLEFALMADGVAPEDLYPLDVERAFAKLDEIKPHIAVWWTSGSQPAQMLVDNEVVLASGWNGRFFAVISEGAPIGIEYNEAVIKEAAFGIPAGAPHSYWAQRLLAEITDPQNQGVYANELAYPGLNLASIEFVDPEIAPYLPTHPDHVDGLIWTDIVWWRDNGEDVQRRWNRWIAR